MNGRSSFLLLLLLLSSDFRAAAAASCCSRAFFLAVPSANVRAIRSEQRYLERRRAGERGVLHKCVTQLARARGQRRVLQRSGYSLERVYIYICARVSMNATDAPRSLPMRQWRNSLTQHPRAPFTYYTIFPAAAFVFFAGKQFNCASVL